MDWRLDGVETSDGVWTLWTGVNWCGLVWRLVTVWTRVNGVKTSDGVGE